MAQVYHDDDADLSLVAGRAVAVLGYGSQGHAHALCLRDSGVAVVVGLPEGSKSRARAEEQGLAVTTPEVACAGADLVVVLVPDTAQRSVYTEVVAPSLAAGKALFFGHGFTIRYGLVQPPPGVDVCLVAPKGPGHLVRRQFVDGKGVPVLVAVEQDATGEALPLALSYAKAIGGTRAGAIRTTFAEETEAGLFGEQAVRRGGAMALVQAAFEVLTEAGYPPEVAYLECLHELKLAVDLMYEGGIARARHGVSETTDASVIAEYGGYSRGPRVVDARVKDELRQILAEVRSGGFVREWVAEDESGRGHLAKWRAGAAAHPIEETGRRLRSMMSWLDRPNATTGDC